MAVEQRAADGTPRAREPYQDEAGNWCCGACGRAHGFKSKHAVLGHLRACRPGKPAIDALMADAGKPMGATGRAVYVPTQPEVTAVGLAAIPGAATLSDLVRRLDAIAAMQQRLAVATGNHITHLSSQNGTSAKGRRSGVSWGTVAAVGALGVGVLSLLNRPALPPVSVPTDSRLSRLCKRLADSGEVVPDECRGVTPAQPSGVSPPRTGGFSFKGLVAGLKDAVSVASSLKRLA